MSRRNERKCFLTLSLQRLDRQLFEASLRNTDHVLSLLAVRQLVLGFVARVIAIHSCTFACSTRFVAILRCIIMDTEFAQILLRLDDANMTPIGVANQLLGYLDIRDLLRPLIVHSFGAFGQVQCEDAVFIAQLLRSHERLGDMVVIDNLPSLLGFEFVFLDHCVQFVSVAMELRIDQTDGFAAMLLFEIVVAEFDGDRLFVDDLHTDGIIHFVVQFLGAFELFVDVSE
mmetsp:Transcript_65408/g.104149  ORF Transcript_65408/g.104149 Transcript_65408/m.104149 type:complete len:229 (+) Transcript_65408:78-764(+)